MVSFARDVWDLLVETKCRVCGVDHVIFMMIDDLLDWETGTLSIEDAFPYLSDDDRELLLSRTCGTCFDSMFLPLDNDA